MALKIIRPVSRFRVVASGPRGAKGEPGTPGASGQSAYEVATANGFVGEEAEWLEHLRQGPKGDPGEAGPAGPNAYDVAVANGFVGTPGAWLASLRGPKGEAGATGSTGAQGPKGDTVVGPQGPAGATGATGQAGPPGASVVGPKGDKGDRGDAGAVGPAGLEWRGPWSANTAYAVDDAVGYGGASWFASAPSTGVTPSNASQSWQLLAAQGAKGDKGDPGATGPASTVPGPEGQAGAPGAAGSAGPAGAPGEDGEPGESAYERAVANGFVGDEAAWLLSLKGERGEKGDAGSKGDPGVAGESITGPQGPAGSPGSMGPAGPAGANGSDGAPGATGPAGPGVAAGGTTGQMLAKSSNADYATAWVAAPSGGGGGLKNVSLRARTAGNLTVPTYQTVGMQDVDATNLEASNAAVVGDVLGLSISGFSDQLGTTSADHSEVGFDVAFMVGTSRVKRLSGTATMNSAAGLGGWSAPWGQHGTLGGILYHVVTAEMLDNGVVRSRLLYGSYYANKRLVYAIATNPLMFHVVNLGKPTG